jgi:hypothetical protein
MGCCNEPVTLLAGVPVDPSQHVNFERGMVLGVDDFKQEFAYLSGRDHWLARDAIGYGTLSGLRVHAEDGGADGPRLHVTAGSALTPGGRLVCVGSDQCAVVNRWLAKPDNAALVNRLLNPSSPPLSPPVSPPMPPVNDVGEITLHLVLCYTDCLTRPVPIPGEPCRSEDELMKPSRVADDYRLELRASPPAQVEEEAVRDFVRWLRANVRVVDVSPPPADDPDTWIARLRDAVRPWTDAVSMSPSASPPASFEGLGDYLFDLGSPLLEIPRGRHGAFLRAAFRFWVTELRPMWMAMRCHRPAHRDLDCVLLAAVTFDVTWVGGSPSGAWQVTGSPVALHVDDAARPFVANLRLLQEFALAGAAGGGDGGGLDDPLADMFARSFGGGFGGGFGGLSDGPSGGMPGVAPVSLSPRAMPHAPVAFVDADLVLDAGHGTLLAHGGASRLTVSLPESDAASAGRAYTIRNLDIGALTIAPARGTSATIDGNATLSLRKARAVTLVADGVGGWHTIAKV